MKKALAFLALALSLSGCIAHSVILGQTAAPVGAGNGEVGLSVGAGYSSTTTTQPPNGITPQSSSTSSGFSFPALEGNAAYGVSDAISLNLHGSRAGVQPGVKLTLLNGDLKLAILPSVAFGVTQTSNTASSNSSNNNSSTAWNVLAGARVIVSYGGGYGAAGYDFYYSHSGDDTTTDTVILHTIAFAIGYLSQGGPMRVGIEADAFFSPAGSTSTTSNNMPSNGQPSSVTDWGVLVAVTLQARAVSH